MKRAKLIGALGFLLAPIFLLMGVAGAQSFRSGDNTTVASGEVVKSTLYAAGRNIDIAGEVQGDVFCAGQNINITGKVTGDVICAGQTVHVSGTVEGDVRAAGQTVTIGSDIKGNLSVGSQSFTLESEGKVGGDATVGGSDMVLNGTVGRDLVLGSGSATLANGVGRNVKAGVEQLNLSNKATIGGWLDYTSPHEATLASGAKVTGSTTRHEPEKQDKGNKGTVFAFSFAVAFYAIMAMLIVALALALLFPHALQHASGLALTDPLKTFLIGLVATFVAPVIIVGLMFTLVGIPLGLLALLAWLLVLFLSGPFFGYAIGRLVLKGQTNPILIMLVGSLIVLVSYLIPILGVLVLLAALWLGTGSILRALYHQTPKPAYSLATKPAKSKK